MANYITLSTVGCEAVNSNGLKGQDAVDNMIKLWRERLDAVLPDRPDMIVLNEACDRYPDYSTEERLDYYRTRGDQVRDYFAQVASKNKCYIAYSAARLLHDGTWRNATEIIDRQGQTAGIYDKNYVVIEETTKHGILPGKDIAVIECDFGRVGCAICFDLNYTELLDRYAQANVDLMVFSSMYHGGLMQPYWAHQCRAYFAGAIASSPDSIIDPLGQMVIEGANYRPQVTARINLDYKVAHLDCNWDNFKQAKAKYGPDVKIDIPSYLGSFLLTSESDTVTAEQIAKEFEIELLDDYWTRAHAHRDRYATDRPKPHS